VDKCSECERIRKILECLPCYEHCVDNQYYTGKSNLLKNLCFNNNKCEYLNGLRMFILMEYPDYALKECCDIEKRDMASPEAIFVNRKDTAKLLSVEMKNLPQFIEKDIKETKLKNSRENYFWDKIIDRSAKQAFDLVVKYLSKRGITQQADIDNLFKIIWNGIVVSLFPKNVNIDVQQTLMNKKKEKQTISELAKITSEFSINIFEKMIKYDFESLQLVRKYNDKNVNLTIYLSKHNDDNIKFEVHSGVTALSDIMKIDKTGLFKQIEKYIISCCDKFINYKEYRNILLINNLYRVDLKQIQNAIFNCTIPNIISEIWITEYHYEEEYNDEGEYIGEYFVDKSFHRIYNVSKQEMI
jgi:hypothetical protein